jgi:hypothetical protein
MEFDWLLFLAIAIVGPAFGSKMCAVLEKKLTGEVRRDIEFKKKRTMASLISIALSYIFTFQIMSSLGGEANHDLNWLTRLISLAIGINVYLLLQHIIYRFLIRNYRIS